MAITFITIACMCLNLLKSCLWLQRVAATGQHPSYDAKVPGKARQPPKGGCCNPGASQNGNKCPSPAVTRFGPGGNCHNRSGFIDDLLAVTAGQD